MRTFVYIDGFNLYYGAVKGTAFKWLNVKELMGRLILHQYQIEKVKYFTATVSGVDDLDAPKRQRIYLNVLRTVPEIEIYFGKFLSKTIWRPLINLPVANRIIATPNPVSLPQGDFVVNGGARTQTLPVGSYGTGQAAASRASRRNVRPLADAIVVHVHTMEERVLT
jgi:hypothetical protein